MTNLDPSKRVLADAVSRVERWIDDDSDHDILPLGDPGTTATMGDLRSIIRAALAQAPPAPVGGKRFEDTAVGKALSDRRHQAACDFKTPQHQGQSGEDWDNGFIAACRVVEQALSTPLADSIIALTSQAGGLVEALAAAVRGLGHISATCVGGPLTRPGDRAREALQQILNLLGPDAYDQVADPAIRASNPSVGDGA